MCYVALVDGKLVKANPSIDSGFGMPTVRDDEAARRKLKRSTFIELLAYKMLPRTA
jgi:hypothetical protein